MLTIQAISHQEVAAIFGEILVQICHKYTK